jgi:sugar phosphate isomerase/epimerase
MARIPVGVQVYSVRDDAAKDLPGTLRALAKMGYEGVEYAGYYQRTAKELRALQDDFGLKCCGTHTGMETLKGDELKRTMDFNEELGNRFLIVPWLPPERRATLQAWIDTAREFNELAERVKARGFRVGYHNHHEEFRPIEGETSAWEMFYRHTTPDVVMQFDTGNARHGNADPVPYLRRHRGRSVTIHLKPFSSTNPAAPIGSDELPWAEIFDACEHGGGTEWYIVEHESDPVSPLEAVRKCLEGLRRMGKR